MTACGAGHSRHGEGQGLDTTLDVLRGRVLVRAVAHSSAAGNEDHRSRGNPGHEQRVVVSPAHLQRSTEHHIRSGTHCYNLMVFKAVSSVS